LATRYLLKKLQELSDRNHSTESESLFGDIDNMSQLDSEDLFHQARNDTPDSGFFEELEPTVSRNKNQDCIEFKCLVDYDPDGFEIFFTYRQGSMVIYPD
jgi:hypothetical protein